MTFPKVNPPIKALYQFDKDINNLFDTTLDAISNLTYARYKPAFYLNENKISVNDKEEQFRQAQQK